MHRSHPRATARRGLLAALAAIAVVSPLFAAETLVVDPNNSSVGFRIRHFVTNVRGAFTVFSGAIQLDEARPENSSVEFSIQAKSVDTGNERRDGHLRSADFFDVANHPTITFKSTQVAKTGAKGYSVTGDLTIRGVTKRITLPVTDLGRAKDSRGGLKVGFETETTLTRTDFGVNWNAPADNGLMLGDEVQVEISLEMGPPPPASPD